MLDVAVAASCGIVVGAAAAAVVSRWVVRRSVARMRAAERRAQSAERLAEVGGMTGGLAHEIKNPLSTIGLNAQLLAESIDELPIEEDEKGRLTRRLSALRREADRLRGILTDFLEYAGELRLDAKPADVRTLVEELVDFFHPQALKHAVRLHADLPRAPMTAVIDAAQVKQAILNLMLNAVQAMAAQDPARPRELIIKVAPGKEADKRSVVVVHVIDTGPGIPPETLPRIFRPYFTTKAGGTGLGLPTTKRIVEAHQGRIDVITTPGQGTDFVLTLPASEEP